MEEGKAVPGVVASLSRGVTSCPHCGRYIGPLELCWYCRKRVKKRFIVRLLKYGSLIGAVLGLVALQQIGARVGTQRVEISRLGKTANFASIEVQGLVTRPISFYPSEKGGENPTGTVTFVVDDGTGVIPVKSYDVVTHRLMADGKVPSLGDRVTLTGTLHIKGNKKSIILSSADHLAIERIPPVAHTPMVEIARAGETSLLHLERATIYGKVKRVSSTSRSVQISLVDPSGNRVDVVMERAVLEVHGACAPGAREWPGAPQKGRFIAATGVLRRIGYGRRRYWKLFPASPGDIVETDEATYRDRNAFKKR
ncbi:MAG: single stranded DNA-binding domain-containing protein [Planctomycetota bacterium]|jgi:hypothetical protein